MAILFRNTAALTIGGMEARLTVYFQDGLLRVELSPYSSNVTSSYTGALDAAVTYGEVSKPLAASPFVRDVSAVFPAADDRKSITLSASSAIVYGGQTAAELTVSWKGDGTLAVPVPRITYASGLLAGASSAIQWTVDGVPEGFAARTLGVWMYRAPKSQIKPQYTRSCLIDRKSADFSLEHTISDLAEKNVLFYRIAVGIYPAASADSAGREDYELYLEMDSPAYVCSGESLYTLAPCSLRCSGLRRNRVVNLTWETLPAAVYTRGFRLDVTYDGSSWSQLFWDACASKSYSLTIPAGKKKAAFRIYAYSSRSKYESSSYLYTPWQEFGLSNVYVGHNGGVMPASEIHIGSAASSQLTVG